MRNINLRYVDETYDENGLLKTYKLKCPDNFNFGYDIVDDIAAAEPDRVALVWDSQSGEQHTFTFSDISRMSNKVANYLLSQGIGKGDVVMLILKQRYQFWFCMVALHKIGAIAAPATHMLTKHDIEYRINAASVKAVICTDQSNISGSVEAAENIPSLQLRALVGEKREGWVDFNAEVEKASDVLERIDTRVTDPKLI